MAQAVFVGGFLHGRSAVKRVGLALGDYFEDVKAFTFSDFVRNPEEVRKTLAGKFAVTHSAGAMALDSIFANPEQALILNPPLPTKIGRLVAGSLVKTGRMLKPGNEIAFNEANRYLRSTAGEFVAHLRANFSQIKGISQFDAIKAAADMSYTGVTPTLVWTQNDAFYSPTESDMSRARDARIPVVMLPGEHDELLLHPRAFAEKLFSV